MSDSERNRELVGYTMILCYFTGTIVTIYSMYYYTYMYMHIYDIIIKVDLYLHFFILIFISHTPENCVTSKHLPNKKILSLIIYCL